MTKKEPLDALAVWQHQDRDWDIWYSLYDDKKVSWYVPGGKERTAPVAVLAGDDHDPDVSSRDAYAVAVWSHKNPDGDYDVYFSEWKPSSWSEPKPLAAMKGNDLDPTVAVSPDSVLIAWVHVNADGTPQLMYASLGGAAAPAFEDAAFRKVSLPELAWSPWGAFGLVFTADDGSGAKAYGSYFKGGKWRAPKEVPGQVAAAVIDNKIPTDQRTGVDGASKGPGAAVWPGVDSQVYAAEWAEASGSALLVDDTMMPDLAFNRESVAHVLYTKGGALWHAANVFGALAKTMALDTGGNDFRNSLTFILGRTIGLTVWWSDVDAPGEIYFSRYDGKWRKPEPVNGKPLGGFDRNPAVTPLQLWTSKTYTDEFCGDGVLQNPPEQCEWTVPCPKPWQLCNMNTCQCEEDWPWPYCGDKVLDPGEQCEVGIACANPNDVCNLANCTCKGKDTPKYCNGQTYEGPVTGIVPPGGAGAGAGKACIDNCPKDEVCDQKNCVCKKTPGESCKDRTPEGGYKPGSTVAGLPKGKICKDDCPPGEKCNSACVCEPTNTQQSCAGNTKYVDMTDKNPFKAGMTCISDCPPGYQCNTGSCTCTPQTIIDEPKPVRKCSDNTPTGNTYTSTFNRAKEACKDDCPEGKTCNPNSCACEPKRRLPCGWGGGGMIFEPNFMYCDTTTCPPEYTCNPGNCLCQPNQVVTGGDGGDGQITDGGTQDPCSGYGGDTDNDGICNQQDNCVEMSNHSQADEDRDGTGDVCDSKPFDCGQHSAFGSIASAGTFVGGAQTLNQDATQWCQGAAGQGTPATCTTLCTYVKVATQTYTVGGQVVNAYSCCYKAEKSLPCSDCPGQNPRCPDKSECTQYNPFPA